MALFKCKMCGSTLEIKNKETVATCEYCGTEQTLPKLDDDKRANLYDRANHYRRNNEYDKAMGIYEQILNEDKKDAEAYWSLILCRYGVEYVEDPDSKKRIPTVNRAQFTSIFDDEDYKSALNYADAHQRVIYEGEAAAINEIHKGILDISSREEAFDAFICYKETDNNGRRTQDSVLATELYHELTREGYKVFFSRITLEDKLGTAYEPYIFAALNSAKVMVVLGTKAEYFNAVWVKNEWSRYLALIKNGARKVLIPAYKNMDPYELPEEFSHLQAQDMSKLGFMQDLIRGIKKIVEANMLKAPVVKETVISAGIANTAPLIKRVFMFLEDGDWNSADEYCEKVLDIDPETAEAYLGKLMAELRVRKKEELKDCTEPFDERNSYKKVLRFADEKLRATLAGYIEHINTRNENARLDGIYAQAKRNMASAESEDDYIKAASIFESIGRYLDSATLAQTCYEKAEITRKDAILIKGKEQMSGGTVSDYKAAIISFESVAGWRDADDEARACRKKIEEIKVNAEAMRLKREQQAEFARKKAQRIAKIIKIIVSVTISIICVVITFIIVLNTVIIPNCKYNEAIALMDAGKYTEAIVAFNELDGYKDSEDKIDECNTAILDGKYNDAIVLMDEGKYEEAIVAFEELNGYKDSDDKLNECTVIILDSKYNEAIALMDAGKYTEAIVAFNELDGYKDSKKYLVDLLEPLFVRNSISARIYHTVGLKSDGDVVAVGPNFYGQCDVSNWTDIVAISAGTFHTVGLKFDGTVVAVGKNDDGQRDVSDWTDIVAISAGVYHTVGLKFDGTVVAVGKNDDGQCDVSEWTDIVAVSAGHSHTVGLKSDGTVVAVGKNDDGQCDVSDWTDIVVISAVDDHTVGLKSDGTVVAVGKNDDGQCDVSDWTDIVAVSAGYSHTVGLKSDGTVVAVGHYFYGQCDVSDWTDIVAISAGGYHTVGLKSDGTVVAVGDNNNDQCDISDWTDIRVYKED